MPLWLEISNGILVIVSVTLAFALAIGYVSYFIIRSQVLEQTKRLEKRLDILESLLYKRTELFMDTLIQKQMNPLTSDENKRKNELLQALKYKRLTIPEAKELDQLLQIELREAQKKNDIMIVVAISAVLLLLAFILSKE